MCKIEYNGMQLMDLSTCTFLSNQILKSIYTTQYLFKLQDMYAENFEAKSGVLQELLVTFTNVKKLFFLIFSKENKLK